MCQQCEKKNFICPGYQKPVKWSTKHQLCSTVGEVDSQIWFTEAIKKATAAVYDSPKTVVTLSPNAECSAEDSSHSASGSPFRDDAESSSSSRARTSSIIPIAEDGVVQLDAPQDGGSISQDDSFLPSDASGTALTADASAQMTRDATTSYLTQILWVPGPFEDETTVIHEYYYSAVCGINSCFDSMQNPFRSTISDLVLKSPLLYETVLSMSAAHLSNGSRNMTHRAIEHQSEAMRLLREKIVAPPANSTHLVAAASRDEETTTTVLLASILLGMTSVRAGLSRIEVDPLTDST